MDTRTRTQDDERPRESPVIAVYIGASRSTFWPLVLLLWFLGSLTLGTLALMQMEKLTEIMTQIQAQGD